MPSTQTEAHEETAVSFEKNDSRQESKQDFSRWDWLIPVQRIGTHFSDPTLPLSLRQVGEPDIPLLLHSHGIKSQIKSPKYLPAFS